MLKVIVRNLLLIATILTSLLTVATGWVSLFHPSGFWFLSLLGLGFQILLFLNLIFMIIWLFRLNIITLIPILAFGIVAPRLPLLYQFKGSGESISENVFKDEISFMSFNVRLFDLYNWSNNQKTRQKILELIAEHKPDIMCLQEFYSSQRDNFDNESALLDMDHVAYTHIEYSINLYGTDNYGIGTFSKHPIVKRGILNFEKKSSNNCIFTDIEIGTDTLRVYNCHLQSVRLALKDYEFIEGLGRTSKEDEKIKRTKNILGRLKMAFIKRALQAEVIAEHISQSPYPVIVCGDFNDTPISYAYKVISSELTDAFMLSGRGFQNTYAGPLPGLRIDYILHSPSISSRQFETLKLKLSDHYPIQAKIVINP